MNQLHIALHRHLCSCLTIILLPVLLLLFYTPLKAADVDTTLPPQKKILILHSYHKGFSWTDGIEKGIRDGLSDLPRTQIFTEYLDSKRQGLAMAEDLFGRYLRTKYLNSHLDLIIVSDNNVLTFLRSKPVEDFIGVPVIFCGINNFSQEMLEGLTPQITGTVEKTDPAETVRIIRQLQPDTKRLFIISGATPTAAHLKAQTEQALASMETGMDITWWHNLDSSDLLNKLSSLTKDDAVLLLTFNRDLSGNYYSNKDSALLVTSATKAPVYGLWEFYLGTGVVGGRMASSYDQGATAATLARRYFENGTLQGIIKNSPNANLFDSQALRSHGIDVINLPSDAIVTGGLPDNRPRKFLSIGGALLAALLIVILLFMLRPLISNKTELIAIINRSVLSITSSLILCLLLVMITDDYLDHQQFVSLRHQQLLETKKQTMVMMVEQAVNLINYEKEQNTLSLKSLQQRVLQQISTFSFQDGVGYLFVLNYDGLMLSNRANPSLIGKDIRLLRDSDGVYAAREIIRLAKQSDGAFVSYLLPKPNRTQPVPKLTYAVGIQDWEWAIGCGLYLDDIELLMVQERQKQHRFFLQELTFLIFISIIGLTLLYFISCRLSLQIRKEITSLEQGLRDQDEKSEELISDHYQIHEFGHIAAGVRTAFSDLSNANAELRNNEQQFIDALQSSPDAMLLLDNEAFIACNQSAATMLGYSNSNELLNIHPSQISPALQPDGQDSITKANELVAIAISQGTTRFEWLHLRKNGHPILIEVTLTLSPLTVSKENTVLQCVLRDLTHEKEIADKMHQVEEERQASLEESERMNRLMSGREERIIEIKEEVNTLLSELGRDTKYGRNHNLIIRDYSDPSDSREDYP
jgi:PAS domain S-box-containing protein